jgi:hypothetical protein
MSLNEPCLPQQNGKWGWRSVRPIAGRVERSKTTYAVGLVATSSLDLGVDFSSVDAVIQIGSTRGIARLLNALAGRTTMARRALKGLHQIWPGNPGIPQTIAKQ